MEKTSMVGKKMLWISMFLVLIALPLFANEAVAQAKPEGTLRVAQASLAEEGFLYDMGAINQLRVFPLVYDYLLYRNEKTNEDIPGLAKRFETSKDGLTMTIYLREGIPFHEGWGEVTAEDVKYTFERVTREGSMASRAQQFREFIKSIEVVNPYTLVLHFKKPNADFWWNLHVAANTGMGILRKKYVETVGEQKARLEPIGTGPYRLAERKSGQYLKFEAYDKHWRLIPEFKYIVVQIVPEESTRVAMLKTGATDIIPISAQAMSDLENEKGITAMPWPGGNSIFACFGAMHTPKDKRYQAGYHRTDPWAKDKRVRQAMNLAIDRAGIIKAIYRGLAKPSTICWQLQGWEKLPLIPYDPKKAKELLAEAGYPNGFSLTIIASADWDQGYELPQVMEIVAANFKAIGLNPKIEMMSKDLMMSTLDTAKTKGWIFNWKQGYGVTYAHQYFDKFGYGTDVNFQSDELTALIDKFQTEMDLPKRVAAEAKIRDYFYNEYVTIPIVVTAPAWAYRDAVVGEWPTTVGIQTPQIEYIRHPKPLNTWRLFTPGQ